MAKKVPAAGSPKAPTANDVEAEVKRLVEKDPDRCVEVELIHELVQPLYPQFRREAGELINDLVMQARSGQGPFRLKKKAGEAQLCLEGEGEGGPDLVEKVAERMRRILTDAGGCKKLTKLVDKVGQTFDEETQPDAELICLGLCDDREAGFCTRKRPGGRQVCLLEHCDDA